MKFNINDAMKTLVISTEYKVSNHSDGQIKESWTIEKPIKTKNDFININIKISAYYNENLLVFIMPLYNEGSFGLRGKYLYIFDSVLHNLNSRTKGGYFSKYTYDDTYAPIYLHHLPLDRMDFCWFKHTLDYFRHVFIAYRPLLDLMREKLGLRFDYRASRYDSGRKFIMDNDQKYLPNLSQS